MTRTGLKSFVMLVALSAVSSASFSAPPAPDETLNRLAGYRHWASIKGEPGQVKVLPAGVPVDLSSTAT